MIPIRELLEYGKLQYQHGMEAGLFYGFCAGAVTTAALVLLLIA
jgi:hypothetical protein